MRQPGFEPGSQRFCFFASLQKSSELCSGTPEALLPRAFSKSFKGPWQRRILTTGLLPLTNPKNQGKKLFKSYCKYAYDSCTGEHRAESSSLISRISMLLITLSCKTRFFLSSKYRRLNPSSLESSPAVIEEKLCFGTILILIGVQHINLPCLGTR